MLGVVITGGEAPPHSTIAAISRRAALVVAADSGFDTARNAGIDPDLVVGDFDSVAKRSEVEKLDANRVHHYSANKDETDTEIAVRVARERGCRQIVLLGGGGGQMSHFVGILSMFDRPDPPDLWLTGQSEFRLVDGSISMTGEVGEQVSFFPVGCGRCTMNSTGLRWSLDDVTWEKGDIGVSNEFSESTATVQMRSGRLLLVRDRAGVFE